MVPVPERRRGLTPDSAAIVGSVQKRTQAGTTSWLARWRDPTGTQRKRSFPRRIDAERFLDDRGRGPRPGQLRRPRATRRCSATTPSSGARPRCTVRRPARTSRPTSAGTPIPTFGDRRLAADPPGEVQAWVARLTQVLAPATVEVDHGSWRPCSKQPCATGSSAASPCKGTKLPKKLPREVVPLTVGMVEALAAAVPPRYRALVVLAAGTDCARASASASCVDRVDFLRRTLRVDRQVIMLPRRPPFLAPPKTPASTARSRCPRSSSTALAAHLERYPRPPPRRLVFTDERRQCPAPHRLLPRDLAPRSPRSRAPSGTGFHELRHFYASLLIRHGSRSRPCNAGSATPPPRRPWTPTRTCGPTPTTGRARRSTPCSGPSESAGTDGYEA